MKFFKNLLYIAAAAASLASTTACNEIDVNDRYIELPAVEAKRVVLLEEFTGQKCVNCPEAHQVIVDLLSQYPDNLVAVSIHAGSDMNAYGEDQLPNGLGLRNTEGAAYGDAYKISAFPQGVVNRTSGVTTMDQWAQSIRTQVAIPTDVELAVEAHLSADGSKIEISTEVSPFDNIKGHLQLWVVESGIVSLQLTDSGYKADYVHNHVFRGTVNGLDGDAVTLTTREPQTFAHTADIKTNWNPENLAIVAFIYTPQGVVQAAETKVKASADNVEN